MESGNLGEGMLYKGSLSNHGREIARWTIFISVSGFVFSALLVIIGIFGGSILTNLEQASAKPGRNAALFSFYSYAGAGISFLVSASLLSFGRAMRMACQQPALINLALQKLKFFFRLAGIILILGIIYGIWFLFSGPSAL